MSRPLIIFGKTEMAELAHFYFSRQSEYDIVAFTVDRQYLDEERFCGLPVIAYEQLEDDFPANDYDMFIALAYTKLNQVRKEKYLDAKSRGYRLATFVSESATVLTDDIGENCFIFEDNTIQPFVSIGNNVTLWSGNHVGHHSRIHDHCFVASHAVISGCVEIGESCFIGVNATLRDHIKVGKKCIIGAGALLLEDAEPEGLYMAEKTSRSRVPSTRIRNI